MENISFVIWMLFYFPLNCLASYIYCNLLHSEKMTQNERTASALINLVIYIYIASNLYRK